MSPRAALRLETLGFQNVYDYVAGKGDGVAHGLPTEGLSGGRLTAGDLVRRDVPRRALTDRVADVAQRIASSGYGFALVLGKDDVVLGRIRRSAVQGREDARAGDVMEPGPSTIRAHVPVEEAWEQMRQHDLKTMLVTTPEGRLLGVLSREDVEAARQG
jgi:CBS domain-containing protein